jgi:2-amino-4-hydroxy-6-hydroxymethyldihydropteridine diphosphokinase
VLLVDTPLPPRTLLDLCLEIEAERGRRRVEAMGPRTLDIDLLFWGAVVIDEPGLVLPHPRMKERRFVLEPLVDVWGTGPVPGLTDIEAERAALAHQQVRRIAGPDWIAPRRRGLASAGAVLAIAAGVVAAAIVRGRRA